MKQNKFAVALLTSGDIVRWNNKSKPYLDPRATTIPLNTYYSEAMNFKGLSINSRDLLANNSLIGLVKSRNLSLYVWGEQLNSKHILNNLIQLGADGLIFDRIDKILSSTDPEHSTENSAAKLTIMNYKFILIITFNLLYLKIEIL